MCKEETASAPQAGLWQLEIDWRRIGNREQTLSDSVAPRCNAKWLINKSPFEKGIPRLRLA